MAPEERREALIAATIPLLHEHGVDVSTRQIAAAAGVAEGTIFGVFETKTSLVMCSVIRAIDPQPTLDALAAIDRSLPLRERLARAADLLHGRMTESMALMGAARKLFLTAEADPEVRRQMLSSRERLQAAVADVIRPDAGLLRRSPAAAASLLLIFCSANTFGPVGDPEQYSGEETASLLLDGLLQRGAQSTC